MRCRGTCFSDVGRTCLLDVGTCLYVGGTCLLDVGTYFFYVGAPVYEMGARGVTWTRSEYACA
jgi:hypothetical protein